MKQIFHFILTFALLTGGLGAQSSSSNGSAPAALPETDSNLRGIKYQVFRVKRIPGSRVMFIIQVYAAAGASPNGTLLGTAPPAGVPASEASDPRYQGKPFTLLPSTMIESSSQASYAAEPPVPGGASALPATTYTTVRPGDGVYLSVQFPAPPLPESVGGSVPKQTVSLQLNNARGPVTDIVIPPPTPDGAPASNP